MPIRVYIWYSYDLNRYDYDLLSNTWFIGMLVGFILILKETKPLKFKKKYI